MGKFSRRSQNNQTKKIYQVVEQVTTEVIVVYEVFENRTTSQSLNWSLTTLPEDK